ncbi:MAG: FlgD immunoglobulin-like domain containing protein [Bacteroidota bacterium]
MKYRVLLAVGAALGLYFGATTQQAQADVTADFRAATKVGNRPYTPLVSKTVLPADDFRLPPQIGSSDPADRDDGYVRVNLPFQFSYNGTLYSDVWININGFVLFTKTQPPNIPADNPQSLFTNTQPVNIVAPFFGDHYYRKGPGTLGESQYLPSEISYGTRSVNDGSGTFRNAFIVQWQNLNINNELIPSSVANFQLYLYESDSLRLGNTNNFQGDIEFAYGQIGGNGSTVVTQGASVGIKGENGDYINALEFNGNINTARTSTRLSNLWQPSGGSDTVVRLSVNVRLLVSGWGDGDADLSQVGKHRGLPQNRFVTVNDARVILRAQAMNRPLDSLRERNAFHGDVNHNGRYYFSTRSADNSTDVPRYRRSVINRNLSDYDLTNVAPDNSLPFLAGNPSFFFEATEYDAALIMLYMSGRVPTLPWLLDTIIPYGRAGVNEKSANDVAIGTPVNVDGNTYRIPVQLNGFAKGAIATKFNVNGEILEVSGVELGENKVLIEGNGSTVVISATGEFNANEPIAYITVKTSDASLTINEVRFNDNQKSGQSILVNKDENANTQALSNYPNPVVNTTSITVAIPQNGNYELAIFDMLGNKVKTLKAGLMDKGMNVTEWNGTDDSGNSVGAGTYTYRLQGEGMTMNKTLVVIR